MSDMYRMIMLFQTLDLIFCQYDLISKHLHFRKFNIEVKIVIKFDYAEKLVQWADAIFTAGGDGTFLMAATKVRDHSKPVIGINTDPIRLEYSSLNYFIALTKHHLLWKFRTEPTGQSVMLNN